MPDPGFSPLIAARLAARALAEDRLTDAERIAAIGALAPVAVNEPTAFHTVLARLLQAWRPDDPEVLARLTDLAADSAEQDAPDTQLVGQLTAYVP